MSVEFYRESPGMFDSRTLSRETLSRWTGRVSKRLSRRCMPNARSKDSRMCHVIVLASCCLSVFRIVNVMLQDMMVIVRVIYIYIYIYIYTHTMYVYIYIYREREMYTYVCIYIYIYIYMIYIYI